VANVLSRTDEALTPEEITSLLRKRIGDEHVLDTIVEYQTFTIVLSNAGYRAAAELCRDDQLLAFDMFETSIGIDEREDGLSVVSILYSTTKGVRLCLKTLAEGGREQPVVPSLADLYPGANWSERETWDMFGIEFDGHPGLAPRILTVENFEGWPLRKDFYLATREAKPWPGVKEPAELDEAGNVIERIPGPGDAPGPMALDKAMADQAKLANPSLADPEEPVTEPASDDVGDAEAAPDSGAVMQTEKQTVEEAVTENAAAAKQRAEEQRVAAAEARARKAAERADAANVSTPEEDVPEVPKGTEASPEAGTQGGPPAQAPADDAGTVDVDGTEPGISTTPAGIDETADRARREGQIHYVGDDGPEAPVEPEGREVPTDEDTSADPDEAIRPDAPPPSEGNTDREDDA
jgi:NADH:ubiquinone oxidoreductase subunit C